MMLDLSALQDRVQKIRISSIQDDPSPLSDVVSASIIVIRHLDDALDILDSTSTAKTTPEGATVILSDMLGVADNILKSLAKLLIESTDLSDVVSAAKILVATGSDHVELSEEILKQLAGLQQESNSVSDTVIRMVERVRSAQDVLLLPIERLYLKRRIVPRIVTSLSDRVTIILARAESTSANKGRRTAAPRWLIDLAVQSVARQYSSEDMEVPN
jgi:predicted CopG family antitoxin